jgi:hypothetical protein
MQILRPKDHHNYVAFFLTLACNLRCPWCINRHGGSEYGLARKAHLTADEWIEAANRLVLRGDLPLTLQGGEPTLHRGFYRIVREVRDEIKMDLMTNMTFDVETFIREVPVQRFLREAPYAAIRVSYHPGQNDIGELIRKTKRMEEVGFRVGLYGILHPDEALRNHVLAVQRMCTDQGIDFRTKEFLGLWKGRLYGTFKYEGAVCGEAQLPCECRTTELIVDPGGYVYRCHADLYGGRSPIAHVLDEDFNEEALDEFRACDAYGDCNPCDVKVKTNRYQVFGHTSVEIRPSARPEWGERYGSLREPGQV